MSLLLRYASAIMEQTKRWDLLALKFDWFQNLRNNTQDATTCKTGCANGINKWHATMSRPFARGFKQYKKRKIAGSQVKTGSRLAGGYIVGETIICDQSHKITFQAFTADVAWTKIVRGLFHSRLSFIFYTDRRRWPESLGDHLSCWLFHFTACCAYYNGCNFVFLEGNEKSKI